MRKSLNILNEFKKFDKFIAVGNNKKEFRRISVFSMEVKMKKILYFVMFLFVFFLNTGNLVGDEKKIILGIARVDGGKYNVEFRKYHRTILFYQKNNIEPVLFDYIFLPQSSKTLTEKQMYEIISRFHVIHLATTIEGVGVMFGEEEKGQAQKVANVLKKYVENGGGLFIQAQSVRYPNTKDEDYWNEVLKPFGIEILHECIFDKTREYKGKTINEESFFYTQNILPHPITEGIKCLYLPLHSSHPGPGTVALKYSQDWQILIRGEKECQSYKSGIPGDPNVVNLENVGTYISYPPILAIREMGKGRIVSYPISEIFTGLNYLNPLWDNTVEEKGDPLSGRKSDSWQLQMNCYKWLGENALKIEQIGTYKFEPYKEIVYPEKVSWDKYNFSKPLTPTTLAKGIVGAHSSYTDGEGNVFDYVEECKKQGLSFIVFTDPLELLTPQKLNSLINDCKKASGKDFYACPGIEFTDGNGIRWIMIGENIKFPPEKFISGGKTYTQWDGKKVNYYGHYAIYNNCPQTGIIDYKELRKVGGYPENLWWFFLYIPLAYDKDKLIADNYDEFLFGLRDLRWSSLISFTRIKKPSDIKIASNTEVTIFRDIESAKNSLNKSFASYWTAYQGLQQVSQGPIILQWETINSQMENNWMYTKGAQRVRLKFEVFSENGVKEVIVHDANYGIMRRFDGKGEKIFGKEFEVVHDKQHYLTLEVIDNKKKKAFSHYILVYCYKQGLFRCGDNLNILGPLGFWWHPDRNEMLPLGKDFRNGGKYALVGWDTAQAAFGVPQPKDVPCENIDIKDIGWYPDRYKIGKFVGKIMNVKLAGHDMQIVSMNMDHLVSLYDTENIPTPSYASLPLNQGEIEYFERDHTMIAPADRVDFFIGWNYRRYYESIKNYEGSFVWHEGYIKIKKDIELGSGAIPLLQLKTPFQPEKGIGNLVFVKEPEGIKEIKLTSDKKQYIEGKIQQGGYISYMPTVLGYTAVFIPKTEKNKNTKWTYFGELPGYIFVRIGEKGEKIKKDTILEYNFIYGVFAEKKPGKEELEETVKKLNLNGGKDGYPIKIEKGEIDDTIFFFTAKANDNEAVFTLGPCDMIIDLPIRVKGIEDNGCAAIYSTQKPWFRFVSVYDNTAYFQEPIEKENKIWVGNIFVCDDKNLKITVIVDGQDEGKEPFIEIHNPTDKNIETKIWSPEKTPLFGGMSFKTNIPAGDSKFYMIKDGKFIEIRNK